MVVALEGSHEIGKYRLQPLTADPIRRFPQNDECLGYGFIVNAPATAHGRLGVHGCALSWRRATTEQTDRVFAVVPADGDELIQDTALLLLRRNTVPASKSRQQLCLGLLADPNSHCVPPGFGNITLRQQHAFGNQNSESTRGEKLLDAGQGAPASTRGSRRRRALTMSPIGPCPR